MWCFVAGKNGNRRCIYGGYMVKHSLVVILLMIVLTVNCSSVDNKCGCELFQLHDVHDIVEANSFMDGGTIFCTIIDTKGKTLTISLKPRSYYVKRRKSGVEGIIRGMRSRSDESSNTSQKIEDEKELTCEEINQKYSKYKNLPSDEMMDKRELFIGARHWSDSNAVKIEINSKEELAIRCMLGCYIKQYIGNKTEEELFCERMERFEQLGFEEDIIVHYLDRNSKILKLYNLLMLRDTPIKAE